MKTSDKLAFLVIALAVGFGLVASNPKVTPAVPTPAVTANASAISVANSLTGFPNQAKQLSAFYRDFSKVLKDDAGKTVTTTGQFHASHVTALKLFVASDAYAGAPPVGDKIGEYLAKSIGGKSSDEIDDQAFGPVQSSLCTAMDELSQAFAQVK